MFNTSYHLRATRGGLVPVGEVLQEMVDRAADRQSFYRPIKKMQPGAAKTADVISRKSKGLKGETGKPLSCAQLELFHVEPGKVLAANVQRVRDPERPLLDLFPEAYTQ